MKRTIDVETPKGLYEHALHMSRTYTRFGTYRTVESCLVDIIEKRQIVDSSLIKEATVLARVEDKKFERIVSC